MPETIGARQMVQIETINENTQMVPGTIGAQGQLVPKPFNAQKGNWCTKDDWCILGTISACQLVHRTIGAQDD